MRIGGRSDGDALGGQWRLILETSSYDKSASIIWRNVLADRQIDTDEQMIETRYAKEGCTLLDRFTWLGKHLDDLASPFRNNRPIANRSTRLKGRFKRIDVRSRGSFLRLLGRKPCLGFLDSLVGDILVIGVKSFSAIVRRLRSCNRCEA